LDGYSQGLAALILQFLNRIPLIFMEMARWQLKLPQSSILENPQPAMQARSVPW